MWRHEDPSSPVILILISFSLSVHDLFFLSFPSFLSTHADPSSRPSIHLSIQPVKGMASCPAPLCLSLHAPRPVAADTPSTPRPPLSSQRSSRLPARPLSPHPDLSTKNQPALFYLRFWPLLSRILTAPRSLPQSRTPPLSRLSLMCLLQILHPPNPPSLFPKSPPRPFSLHLPNSLNLRLLHLPLKSPPQLPII